MTTSQGGSSRRRSMSLTSSTSQAKKKASENGDLGPDATQKSLTSSRSMYVLSLIYSNNSIERESTDWCGYIFEAMSQK